MPGKIVPNLNSFKSAEMMFSPMEMAGIGVYLTSSAFAIVARLNKKKSLTAQNNPQTQPKAKELKALIKTNHQQSFKKIFFYSIVP